MTRSKIWFLVLCVVALLIGPAPQALAGGCRASTTGGPFAFCHQWDCLTPGNATVQITAGGPGDWVEARCGFAVAARANGPAPDANVGGNPNDDVFTCWASGPGVEGWCEASKTLPTPAAPWWSLVIGMLMLTTAGILLRRRLRHV